MTTQHMTARCTRESQRPPMGGGRYRKECQMTTTTVTPTAALAELRYLRKVHGTILAEIRRTGYVRDCEECGVNLYPEPPEPFGFFMLADPVWNIASLDGRVKCLCLSCTESVLGTRLPSWAFRVAEMVPEWLLTDELQDRLNPETDSEFQQTLDDERAVIAKREFPNALMRGVRPDP